MADAQIWRPDEQRARGVHRQHVLLRHADGGANMRLRGVMPVCKAMRLLTWWDEREQQVSCEVDAYGDLLQALGPEADDEYIGQCRRSSGDSVREEGVKLLSREGM
eukprot:766753-Hanusia_phi.AAC.5